MYKRRQIFEGSGSESIFFWGARQTGKSTLLKQLFPEALFLAVTRTKGAGCSHWDF